jgi:TolB-like protein
VALLPLENLTGKSDAADALTRMLFVELVRSGKCEMVESGIVDTALVALRIRETASLTAAQMKTLGETLNVTYLIMGTALESGAAHTPDGDVPSVGVALKLLDVRDARVLWADMRFRTGDDKESVFGWGREANGQRLAASMVGELLKGFHIPQASPPKAETGGTK